MNFLAKVVTLWSITVAVPVYGQVPVVDIVSDLVRAGRKFSCTDEVVTYTCSGEGNDFFVNSPPLFNQHAFFSSDNAPDVARIASSDAVLLTLRRGASDYLASLQIRVPNVTQHMRINISCSTDIGGSLNSLPLIHESQIEPPSSVTFSGDTTVSWTPPVNPQFDINYYVVRIYVDGGLYTTRSSRDNGLDVKLPSGEVTADVRTVTTCGSISAAQQAVGSVSGGCANGSVVSVAGLFASAGSLVTTLISVLIIIAVIV